ncbi:MAG: hypothetical protein QM770_03950 [Tepidisphaeraceae bacterium]
MASPTHHPETLRPRVQWRWFFLAVGVLLVVYGSMLNPYWVPSGDGDVYTAIARSIVQGHGYRFNGAKAAIAPPGWPLVLAAAMKLSPTFLFFKLITIGCMTGSLAVTFFILRRFVSDRHAAGLVILTGVLAPLYPLTFWTHTEALFCLLGSGAILLAMRIAERRTSTFSAGMLIELVGMTALLAAASFTRWPGFLHAVLIAGVLLRGTPREWLSPAMRHRLVALVLACVACGATFLGTRYYLSLTPSEKRAATAAGAVEEREDPTVIASATTVPTTTTTAATTEATQPTTAELVAAGSDDDQTPEVKVGFFSEYLSRVVNAGRWFAWLLWYPTRFGQSVPVINFVGQLCGWLAIFVLIATLWTGVRQREWFWAGLALYTGGLIVIWPNPNARYFVPVAPYVLLGVVLGLHAIGREMQWSRWGRGVGMLVPVFVGSVIVTNVALLTIDIVVMRSGKSFYRVYEGGANEQLLQIAAFINADPTPGRIAASEKYVNLGKPRFSKFGIRAMHLLTAQPVISTQRRKATTERPTRELNTWAAKNSISYYVFQAPLEPWRLWHFRLPHWLQAKLSKTPPGPATGGWELYSYRRGKGLQSVPLPQADELVTRVPGL